MRALVVPTRREQEAVLRALPKALPVTGLGVRAWRRGDLLIVASGMGSQRAAAALPELARAVGDDVRGTCEALWLVGWCGGLRDDLQVADLVLADATWTAAGTQTGEAIAHVPRAEIAAWAGRLAAAQGRRLIVGPVLTSPRVLFRAEEKRAAAQTGAVAVEMEAGPLARWAAAQGVPFVHLRVVLDPAASSLPAVGGRGEREQERRRSLLRRTLWRPRTWPAVWRLIRQAWVAGRAITDLVAALVAVDGPLATGH